MKGQPIESHTCDRHQFFLRRQKDNIINPQLLQASFCQPRSSNPLKQAEECKSCPHLDCPVFNFDRNCATPTFVLRLDRKYYEWGDKVRIEHEDFPIAESAEKSQLFEPKPKSKNNYCHVCRATYKDYRSHIKRKAHRDNIRRSVFNLHILELTDRYRMKRWGSSNRRGRTKMERIQPTRDEDSDVGVIAPAPVRRAGQRDDAWALAPNLSNYTTQINWYDQIPTANRAQELTETLRWMNYQQQQQFMAFQTAFHHSLQNFPRNASHFGANSHRPPSHPQGRSRSITYIIIDQ